MHARKRSPPLDIRPIAGALGAEIHGVDLSRDLTDGVIATIRQVFLDHLVVFFRDQSLSPAQFMAFARTIGRPMEYPFVKGLDGFPEITAVIKRPDQTIAFGGNWHTDTTYFEAPPMATMLLAHELPPKGGDTQFANQYLAYEALSDGMKSLLSGLRWVSRSDKAEASRTREDRSTAERTVLIADHPVVRTHPETGRKSLFVNLAHTAHFLGMTEAESAGLLRFLFQHQIRPEFTCRFRWAPGSVALWDNRCTLHAALNDYNGFRREMWRITLAGDVPV
jgi:taurine dioxygenase